MKRHRQLLAFTLLEIMVALALLSIIIVAIYSSWSAIIKGSQVAREVAITTQRTRITMRTLQDSLLCACMYNGNAAYYNFLVDSDAEFSSFSFVARLPRSFPRSGKFGDVDVRRLSFTVEPGPDSKKQLVLRQNPLLMEVDKDEKEFPLVLARDVDKFIVEYIDPKTGDWTPEWVNSNQLPREVRIQLTIGHTGRNSIRTLDAPMVGTVAMAAQPVRLEWQAPMNAGLGGGGGGGNLNNNNNNNPQGNNNNQGQGGFNTKLGVPQ